MSWASASARVPCVISVNGGAVPTLEPLERVPDVCMEGATTFYMLAVTFISPPARETSHDNDQLSNGSHWQR